MDKKLYTEGFSFDLEERNQRLKDEKGVKFPKVLKTGTTIVGMIFSDGVVLGADTRSTSDHLVADKNCEKIHHIVPNISCCGAGTAADTENITSLLSSKLNFLELQTERQARVCTAVTMLKQMLFPYQGHISAALVLGGVDVNGPQLHMIHPHGSTAELPFATMGSGSAAAMAILENSYQPNMSKDQAVDLVIDAVQAGIFNDLGSGSNVDIAIITSDGREMRRNTKMPNKRIPLRKSYDIKSGSTIVLKTTVIDFEKENEKNTLIKNILSTASSATSASTSTSKNNDMEIS